MATKAGKAATAGAVYSAVKEARGGHAWGKRISALPKMLAAVFSGRWAGPSRTGVVLPLLGYLYVLSPIDLIPEILLGPFGLGDDIAVAIASTLLLIRTTDTWIDSQESSPMSEVFSDGTGEVIQGEVIH